MDERSVFNATVCIIGIAILLIHAVNIFLKKGRRKDENSLLTFILFTIIHFAIYLTFTFIKVNYKSNPLIIGFYTTFFVMNNIELLLLFKYTIEFVALKNKTRSVLRIVNIITFSVFIILDILNIFTHIFFYADNGVYMRTKAMIISQGYQVFVFIVVLCITAFNPRLTKTERIAFPIYCLLPLVAIVLQIIFAGYAIAYLSIVISIEILFLFINFNKNIQLANEEKHNRETEIKLMMSQIRPHFIYNTLSSISTLIKIDPEKAQKSLDNFTEYLRANLTSISETGLVSFEKELTHIKTYLSLEKMRFDERLKVVFDIQCNNFFVPPLSIQPIVENSVKHGLMHKIEGGIITIKTYEDDYSYFVEISDDGVGFDVNSLSDESSTHIGLNNIKYRLTTMCNAELKIKSTIDVGTTVIVKFMK